MLKGKRVGKWVVRVGSNMRVQSSVGQAHIKEDRIERNEIGNNPAGEANKHETLET